MQVTDIRKGNKKDELNVFMIRPRHMRKSPFVTLQAPEKCIWTEVTSCCMTVIGELDYWVVPKSVTDSNTAL